MGSLRLRYAEVLSQCVTHSSQLSPYNKPWWCYLLGTGIQNENHHQLGVVGEASQRWGLASPSKGLFSVFYGSVSLPMSNAWVWSVFSMMGCWEGFCFSPGGWMSKPLMGFQAEKWTNSPLGVKWTHSDTFFPSSFYCCSSTVVSIFTPPLPSTTAILDSHLRSYPHLALSMCPLYMFLDDPFSFFPIYPLPSTQWLLSVCYLFQCLWLYFVCLFVLLIRFHLEVRSYSICISLPGLFHLA